MIFGRFLLLTAWPSVLSLAAMLPTFLPSAKPADPLHVWAGHVDPAHLDAWVAGHLEAQQHAVQQLLAGQAALAEETSSWPYRHNRDLTGFIDGTENPMLLDAPAAALLPQTIFVTAAWGGPYRASEGDGIDRM